MNLVISMFLTAAAVFDAGSAAQYFDQRLEGVEVSAPDFAVSAAAVDSVSAELWQLWREANSRFDEPKLTSLEPFDSLPGPNGLWPLPDGDMRYVYASKGTVAPTEGRPLFVYLHGSGPNDPEFNIGAGWCLRFDDAPSAYFIPRSPKGGSECRWYQPSRQFTWERLLRQAFLTDSINPDRVYVLGISEGGYGSQRLAAFYPDYWAGAGPIAGGEPAYNCDPANMATLAFCQQTGELDTMFGRSRIVAAAQAEWDSLATAHPGLYVHKIDLQPGKGHGCDYTVTTPWLKQYSRNPQPKYFYWERAAIGNVLGEGARARSGAYNLVVLEGQNGECDGEQRDAYEMTIAGNNIDLKILDVTVTADNEVSENGWTIKCGATRTKRPATRGKVRLYLSNDLVDLSQPVRVTVNGRELHNGSVELQGAAMLESIATFFDPRRIFPAAIELAL